MDRIFLCFLALRRVEIYWSASALDSSPNFILSALCLELIAMWLDLLSHMRELMKLVSNSEMTRPKPKSSERQQGQPDEP